tara:strand:+ start:95 stop:589 length:495 start_codon:yes stop_codon:yes gene_type:complete
LKQFSILDTKFGKFGIISTSTKLKNVILPNKLESITLDITHPNNHSLIMKKSIDQLNQYFLGELIKFNIEYELSISSFYKEVLNEVYKIPYGKTASYKYISKKVDNSLAYRAVANANAGNPIPIIIPCHRVILSNGTSGDYGGGKKLKQNLIDFEKENIFKSLS